LKENLFQHNVNNFLKNEKIILKIPKINKNFKENSKDVKKFMKIKKFEEKNI